MALRSSGFLRSSSGKFLPTFWDNLSVMNYHYSLCNSPEERSTRSVILLAIMCVTFSDVKVGKFEPDTSRLAGSKGSTCRSGTPIVWLQFFYKSCLFLAHICNYNRKVRLRVRQPRKCGWNSSRDKRYSSPKRPDRRRSLPNLLFNRYRRSRVRGMKLTIHIL